MTKPFAPETIAAQAGGKVDEASGAIIPPIHLATTYIRDPDNEYRRGYSYSRPDNPLTRQVEDVLCQLEGGSQALVLGSGMSAATAAFLALERPAHIVAPSVMYWGLKKWLAEDAPALGLRATFVDATRCRICAAIEPGQTRMIWIETPANPMWGVSDIEACARLAHDAGALLGVDSTVATPVLSRPLALGADVVMHSATKYLNGHSDVLAGALVLARSDAYATGWPASAPCWACDRTDGGLLAVAGHAHAAFRVRHQSAAAMEIARHFSSHRRIEAVLYPGLPAIQDTPWPAARCRADIAECCPSVSGAEPRPPYARQPT